MYTEEIKEVLTAAGFTPVTTPDPDNFKKDLIFIQNEVVWAKLFNKIKQDQPDLEKALNSVPHINWIKNIIISRNPILQPVDINGNIAYAVVFKEVIEKREKLQHLDRCLSFVFMIVQVYFQDLTEGLEF